MNDRMNDVISPLAGALRRRTASAVCAAVIFSVATAVALASDESGGLTPAPTARSVDAAGFNDAPAVADGSASAAFADSDGFTRSDDFARGLIRRLDGDARVFGYRALHAALNTLDGGDLDSELTSIRTSAGDALFAAVADGALERLRLGLDDSFIRSFSLSYQSPFASGGAKASASAVAALWGDSDRLLFAQFGGRAAVDSTDSNYGSFGFGLRRRVGGAIFGGNVFADLTAGGNRRHSFGLEARHRGAALAANVYVGDGHLASGRTIEGSGRIPGLSDWAEFGAKFSQWDGSAADGGDELAAEYRLSFYPLEGFRVNFKQSQEAGAAASRGVLAEFGWLLGAAGVAGAAIALGDSNGDDDINSPVGRGGLKEVTPPPPPGDPANPAMGLATGQTGVDNPDITLVDLTDLSREGESFMITLTADATPSAANLIVTLTALLGVSADERARITAANSGNSQWELATPIDDYQIHYSAGGGGLCSANRRCEINWTTANADANNRVALEVRTVEDTAFELTEFLALAVVDGSDYESLSAPGNAVGEFTGGGRGGTGGGTPPDNGGGGTLTASENPLGTSAETCEATEAQFSIAGFNFQRINASACTDSTKDILVSLTSFYSADNYQRTYFYGLNADEWQVQAEVLDMDGNPVEGVLFRWNPNGEEGTDPEALALQGSTDASGRFNWSASRAGGFASFNSDTLYFAYRRASDAGGTVNFRLVRK